jgi:hypothetical protein
MVLLNDVFEVGDRPRRNPGVALLIASLDRRGVGVVFIQDNIWRRALRKKRQAAKRSRYAGSRKSAGSAALSTARDRYFR